MSDAITTRLPDNTQATQLPLFTTPAPGRGQRDGLAPPPLAPFPGQVSANSSLNLALSWFEEEMARMGYAPHTRENYRKGVARLVRFLGHGYRLGDVTPGDIRRFHAWLQEQPRAAKTKELTLSAVRAFFKALVSARVLNLNPTADVYPTKAYSPLPNVLYDTEVSALRQAADDVAGQAEDPDPLPALLLTLFLDLGLRLGEVEKLQIADVDLSNPGRPVVHVHYQERRHRNKQRSLAGPAQLTGLLRSYLEHYAPEGPRLFPWTRRRIQDFVRDLGIRAGLRQPLSPNTLRWTYALVQWKAGVSEDTQRARLGLSLPGWEDVKRKLKAMAREPV